MAWDVSSSVRMEETDASLGYLSCSVLLWAPVPSGWLHGETSAVALLPAFLLPVVASLETCPAAPSFCQRRCLPQPQIKNAKGAARKSGSPYLSGLMSKMFQSSGNLLQSGTLSLLLQRASQREGERERNEREEKWYLAAGSDRSTFLSIDTRSEWGVLLLSCGL